MSKGDVLMTYQVQVDVVFTGEIYVEAKNEKEAAEIASNKYFVPADLHNFRFLSLEVVDVQEDEDDD